MQATPSLNRRSAVPVEAKIPKTLGMPRLVAE